jgi:hypothetical protein
VLDVVPALGERPFDALDESAEIGIVRPRVHLRDEQDLHVREACRVRPRACEGISHLTRARPFSRHDRYAGR